MSQVHAVLDSFGKPRTDRTTTGLTHIFSPGHGISQFTPPEHVAALVGGRDSYCARSASVEPHGATLCNRMALRALQPIPLAAGGKVATNPWHPRKCPIRQGDKGQCHLFGRQSNQNDGKGHDPQRDISKVIHQKRGMTPKTLSPQTAQPK